MSLAMHNDVAVIIAVRNAEATIAQAVSSALDQTQTSEVVVVDDASQDRTAGAAKDADDGTGRLNVLRLDKQAGPSRARNIAIDASRAKLIAVLDGDDVLIPGRFDWLLEDDDWDFVADNIVMYRETTSDLAALADTARHVLQSNRPALTLQTFVEGNISGSVDRKELGFLKPVMRRDFLTRAGLRYNETIRFAEDYDLYCRALIAGARFRIDVRVGYGALVHGHSLSATHSTADLATLVDIDGHLLASPDLDPGSREALDRHRRHIASKYHYRTILDRRKLEGRVAALKAVIATPSRIPDTVRHLARDKLRAWLPLLRPPSSERALLLPSNFAPTANETVRLVPGNG